MTRQVEAVFKDGVFRPVEQGLLLAENQHVMITISDMPTAVPSVGREEELKWLRSHGSEYRGQWVALQGGDLLSHGDKALAVRKEARKKGFARPLMVRVPEGPELPSAGWL